MMGQPISTASPADEARAREVLAAECGPLTMARQRIERGHTTSVTSTVAIRAMLAFAHQSPSRAADIPAGMKPYGPSHPDYPNAPSDWDEGPYLCRDGKMYHMCGYGWRHGAGCWNPTADWDRIAYTPKSTPHPVTGNDELTGREPLGFLEDLSLSDRLKRIAAHFERSGLWNAQDAIAYFNGPDYACHLREAAKSLTTPAELPALPLREEIARALFDFDVATEKRLGRQRNRRWESEMEEYREHMREKADAILSLFAARNPPASVAEVVGLRAALEDAQRDLGHIEHRLRNRSYRDARMIAEAARESARAALTPMPSGEKGCPASDQGAAS